MARKEAGGNEMNFIGNLIDFCNRNYNDFCDGMIETVIVKESEWMKACWSLSHDRRMTDEAFLEGEFEIHQTWGSIKVIRGKKKLGEMNVNC